MAKDTRKSKGKEIRPIFLVFCEGESEEAYIRYIRCKYRIPIRIEAKLAKNRIDQKFVTRVTGSLPKHEKDKYFLLYDIDIPEMLEKLRTIKNTILLVSNPCIELWFILHICNQTAESSSVQCVAQLERICKEYRKGYICEKLKHELSTGINDARKRAKKLTLYNNPSTSVYRLIDELDKVVSYST